jgi:acetyl esterase/lipase
MPRLSNRDDRAQIEIGSEDGGHPMVPHLTRRSVLGSAIAGTLATAGCRARTAQGAEIRQETFTYKTVGDCAIRANVIRPSTRDQLPVAVWIHGGALIMGDRRGIDRVMRDELVGAGYALVSIDYRLAPETKLPGILDDVRDAFAWIRSEGPKAFGARPDRPVVLGGSAGGYLTLCTGFLIEPRPAALVSFWGYGDIAGAWYAQPDAFYRRQPLVTDTDARNAVGKTTIAEPPPGNRRMQFYLYCRQNGLWPREVAGLDPASEPRAFDRFCPVRNVSRSYPPTLLIHGTKDSDVPHEQSVLMDEELTRRGVPHEFLSVPDGGHGMGNIDRGEVDRIYRRAVAFVRQYSA